MKGKSQDDGKSNFGNDDKYRRQKPWFARRDDSKTCVRRHTHTHTTTQEDAVAAGGKGNGTSIRNNYKDEIARRQKQRILGYRELPNSTLRGIYVYAVDQNQTFPTNSTWLRPRRLVKSNVLEDFPPT